MDSGRSDSNGTDVVKLFFKQVEEFRNLETRIESLKNEKNGIEEVSKMLIDEMRDFIVQTKRDVKEVSDLAIEAIKTGSRGQEGRGST